MSRSGSSTLKTVFYLDLHLCDLGSKPVAALQGRTDVLFSKMRLLVKQKIRNGTGQNNEERGERRSNDCQQSKITKNSTEGCLQTHPHTTQLLTFSFKLPPFTHTLLFLHLHMITPAIPRAPAADKSPPLPLPVLLMRLYGPLMGSGVHSTPLSQRLQPHCLLGPIAFPWNQHKQSWPVIQLIMAAVKFLSNHYTCWSSPPINLESQQQKSLWARDQFSSLEFSPRMKQCATLINFLVGASLFL